MSIAGIDSILARAIDITGAGSAGVRRVLRVMTRMPKPSKPLRQRDRKRGAATYRAPADMTQPQQIRTMVSWARQSIDRGHGSLVMDFGSLSEMDTSLLAGIVLVARLGVTHQVEVRILNVPERLSSLLEVYRVVDPLRKAGVSVDSCILGHRSALPDQSRMKE